MNPASERMPAHAIDVEKHIIGALLVDPDADGAENLLPSDFFLERHAIIFECLRDLSAERMGVDLLTVSDALRQSGKFDAAGGQAYLLEISAEVVSAANLPDHARIVADKSLKRRQAKAAEAILKRAMSDEPAEETQRLFESEAFSIGERSIGKDLIPVSRILLDSFQILEKRQKGEITGFKTGLMAIDSMTGGLQDDNFIVLGARPAQGKTSLAGQVAAYGALNHGMTVAFFEMEMTGRAVVDRILFAMAGVDQSPLRGARLPTPDMPKLKEAARQLHGARLFMDDTAGITPLGVLSKCRRLKKRNGLDLICVDNIQRMDSDRGERDPRKVVAEASRMLKNIAKDLHVPILAISHIRRLSGGDGTEPTLSDLQESGNVEQDADIVLLLHNPSAYREGEEKGKTKIIFAKNREGPTGYKFLQFEAERTTFSDYSPRQDFVPPPEPARRQLSESDW